MGQHTGVVGVGLHLRAGDRLDAFGMGEAEVDVERGERVPDPVPAVGGFSNRTVLPAGAGGEVSEVEGESLGTRGELPVGDRGPVGVEGGGDDGALVEVEAGEERGVRGGGRHGSGRLVRGTYP